MNIPTYVLDRSLCARCGNEGTLKAEGILDGCPDCPRGREVAKQLAEIQAAGNQQDDTDDEPYGYCFVHGEDWDEGGSCDGCEAER